MRSWVSLMYSKRDVDQAMATTPQAGFYEDSENAEEMSQQATRGLTSPHTMKPDRVKSIDITRNKALDSGYEERPEGRISQQTNSVPRTQDHKRILRSEIAASFQDSSGELRNRLARSSASSRTQDLGSLSDERLKRSQHNGQKSTSSTSFPSQYGHGSPDVRNNEIPGLYEMPEKIDRLSSEMQKIWRALAGLQQDRDEKVVLEKKLKEARHELDDKALALDETRKKWKKTAAELNQLRSQAPGLQQVMDSDIIASVKGLRHAIRGFALQYFSSKVPNCPRIPAAGGLSAYMRETTPGSERYMSYLTSDTFGSIIIQVFLWRVLVGEVFGRFCWMSQLQQSMVTLCQALDPDAYHGEESSQKPSKAAEATRRFHAWRATTSVLIMQSMKDVDAANTVSTGPSFDSDLARQVLDEIHPLLRGSSEDMLVTLENIIEESVVLDQKMCMQMAQFELCYPPWRSQLPFDPEYMEVDMGEMTPKAGEVVDVVTAPAVTKRGKSTGEGFEVQDMLLKASVACVQGSRPERRRVVK